jgi:hypothetical protein
MTPPTVSRWISILTLLAVCLVSGRADAQFFPCCPSIPNPDLVEMTRHELAMGPIFVGGIWHHDDPDPRVGADGTWGTTIQYGWRVSRPWHARIPVVILPTRRVSAPRGDVPAGFTSLFVTPGVRLRSPPGTRWHIYAGGGAGIGRFMESAVLLDGSAHKGSRSNTHVAGHIEFGFEWRFTTRMSVQGSLDGFWAKPAFLSDQLGVKYYPMLTPVTFVTRF